MSENESTLETRSFWEINVYAGMDKGHESIQVEKTITEWQRSLETQSIIANQKKSHWKRVNKQTKQLDFKICTPTQEILYKNIKLEDRKNQPVYAEDGILHFDGNGYLKVESLDIAESQYSKPFGYIFDDFSIKPAAYKFVSESYARFLKLGLGNPALLAPLESFAKYVFRNMDKFLYDLVDSFAHEPYQIVSGENIKLHVSFENDSDLSEQTSELFYLEQDKEQFVSFSNLFTKCDSSSCYMLTWQISGQKYQTLPFQIEEGEPLIHTDKMMNIRVAQDFDRYRINPSEYSGAYFECYSELVPLVILNATDEVGSHRFSKDHQKMFIGSGPEGRNIFKGTIGRVFFDPNSSCTSC